MKKAEGRMKKENGTEKSSAPLPNPLPAPLSRGEGIRDFCHVSDTSRYATGAMI
jgi:hypothetical protein